MKDLNLQIYSKNIDNTLWKHATFMSSKHKGLIKKQI